MTITLTDTSPQAEAVQLSLFRQASVARRVWLMRSLSQTVIQLARQATPSIFSFIAQQYSAELARQLQIQKREVMATHPPDILVALNPVIDIFEELGLAYYVGGSLASSAHGVPRATTDIDLVADLRAEQVATFVARVEENYYVDAQAIQRAIARRASFNLIHLATMLKVDIFIPKETAVARLMASRTVQHPLEELPNARQFNFSSAEDIILAKLDWYKRGGEISERQWSDVLGVLKVQAQALDLEYLETNAADLGLNELLGRAVRESGI